MSKLLERLGMVLPVIQAPMSGVSTPALAAAVSDAGGLGSLGLGAMTVEAARAAIRNTKALTARPFNVNFFCHQPLPPDLAVNAAWLEKLAPFFKAFGAKTPTTLTEIYTSFSGNEPMLAMLLEERPAVASFHFGLPPRRYLEALRDAGIVLIASATNLAEARDIADAGLDAVIAQGVEAGGHRGMFNPQAPDEELGTLVLTRLLVQKTALPVIAAGGIMDGQGIRAALDLGAQAAQLGTAFVSCPESAADDDYRAALLDGRAEHTVLTPVISGRPARGLANRYTTLPAASGDVPVYPYAYSAAKVLQNVSEAAGSVDFSVHWAGQGAMLSRAMPAGALMERLRLELSH